MQGRPREAKGSDAPAGLSSPLLHHLPGKTCLSGYRTQWLSACGVPISPSAILEHTDWAGRWLAVRIRPHPTFHPHPWWGEDPPHTKFCRPDTQLIIPHQWPAWTTLQEGFRSPLSNHPLAPPWGTVSLLHDRG